MSAIADAWTAHSTRQQLECAHCARRHQTAESGADNGGVPLFECSACRGIAVYCSRSCQRAHRSRHAAHCAAAAHFFRACRAMAATAAVGTDIAGGAQQLIGADPVRRKRRRADDDGGGGGGGGGGGSDDDDDYDSEESESDDDEEEEAVPTIDELRQQRQGRRDLLDDPGAPFEGLPAELITEVLARTPHSDIVVFVRRVFPDNRYRRLRRELWDFVVLSFRVRYFREFGAPQSAHDTVWQELREQEAADAARGLVSTGWFSVYERRVQRELAALFTDGDPQQTQSTAAGQRALREYAARWHHEHLIVDLGIVHPVRRAGKVVAHKTWYTVLAFAEALDLSQFAMLRVPGELPALAATLRVLDLSRNRLAELDARYLGPLRRLHTLYAWNNRVHWIDGLATSAYAAPLRRSLRVLKLSGNSIGELPAAHAMAQFTALQELYLDGNQFRVLPAALIAMPTLREVNLAENFIIFLAPEYTQLQNEYADAAAAAAAADADDGGGGEPWPLRPLLPACTALSLENNDLVRIEALAPLALLPAACTLNVRLAFPQHTVLDFLAPSVSPAAPPIADFAANTVQYRVERSTAVPPIAAGAWWEASAAQRAAMALEYAAASDTAVAIADGARAAFERPSPLEMPTSPDDTTLFVDFVYRTPMLWVPEWPRRLVISRVSVVPRSRVHPLAPQNYAVDAAVPDALVVQREISVSFDPDAMFAAPATDEDDVAAAVRYRLLVDDAEPENVHQRNDAPVRYVEMFDAFVVAQEAGAVTVEDAANPRRAGRYVRAQLELRSRLRLLPLIPNVQAAMATMAMLASPAYSDDRRVFPMVDDD